jgi:hypothetical protein
MRAFRRSVVVVLIAVAVSVAAAPHAGATALCVPVRATGEGEDLGEDNGNFRTTADIFVAHHLRVGTTAATFAPTGQSGSVASFAGGIVFTARAGLGTLTLDITGTVDAASGAFRSEGSVSEGTGVFRGTTGNLLFVGTENLTALRFTETVTGRLCAGHRTPLT